MLFDRINMFSYTSGINHIVWHCIIATAIMLLVTILTGGNYVAGAWSGAIFYWSRELAQYEIRKTRFEWEDAIYPSVTVLILTAIITILW